MLFPGNFVLIRQPDGTPFRKLNSFRWLTCRLAVNRLDRLRFELSGDHDLLPLLADRMQIEYWRRDLRYGLHWYRHFSGLYRKLHQERPTAIQSEIGAVGDRSLLERRIVAWPAGTANRSAFVGVKAETIAKTLVKYNLTSFASLANSRNTLDGTVWPASLVTLEADAARGNTLDWYCANDVLLDTLQKLALVAGGDFDLVKSDLKVSALSWDFRFYPGQLGTDRTASLTFAVGRNNMIDPVRDLDLEDEATAALVGGEGQGADRDYLARYGTNYGTNNHIEMFVNSTADTAAGRQAAGDRRLAERQAREVFEFGIQQTRRCVFGRDFFLGDLAMAVNPFTGLASTVKVNAVTVDLKTDGSQLVAGEVATP